MSIILGKIAVFSHLSDAQEMNGFKMTTQEGEIQRLNDIHHKINFAKFLLGKIDLDERYTDEDLNKLWKEYKEEFPIDPF